MKGNTKNTKTLKLTTCEKYTQHKVDSKIMTNRSFDTLQSTGWTTQGDKQKGQSGMKNNTAATLDGRRAVPKMKIMRG